MNEPSKTTLTMLEFLPKLPSIGERLEWAMGVRGVKQAELAKRIGMDQTTISKIKVGKSRNPRKIAKIAEELNVPVVWLHYGITNPDDIKPEHMQAAADLASLSKADQIHIMDLIKRFLPSAE